MVIENFTNFCRYRPSGAWVGFNAGPHVGLDDISLVCYSHVFYRWPYRFSCDFCVPDNGLNPEKTRDIVFFILGHGAISWWLWLLFLGNLIFFFRLNLPWAIFMRWGGLYPFCVAWWIWSAQGRTLGRGVSYKKDRRSPIPGTNRSWGQCFDDFIDVGWAFMGGVITLNCPLFLICLCGNCFIFSDTLIVFGSSRFQGFVQWCASLAAMEWWCQALELLRAI